MVRVESIACDDIRMKDNGVECGRTVGCRSSCMKFTASNEKQVTRLCFILLAIDIEHGFAFCHIDDLKMLMPMQMEDGLAVSGRGGASIDVDWEKWIGDAFFFQVSSKSHRASSFPFIMNDKIIPV
ncbi:hypothetical protein D3C85_1512810 [compost metagenome]